MCKYSQDVADKLIGILTDGNYITTACDLLKISRVTFYNWKNKAELGKQPYAKLFERIAEAEASAEADLVRDIKTDESWQAKAWMLERKHPERWGKKDTIKQELSGTLEIKNIFAELADLQNNGNDEPTSGNNT